MVATTPSPDPNRDPLAYAEWLKYSDAYKEFCQFVWTYWNSVKRRRRKVALTKVQRDD